MCLWDEWLCANRLYSCEQFHTMNMCSNSNNTVASVSLFLLALCLNLALNQTYALLCECKLKDAVFLLPQTPEKLLKRTTCSQVFWEFRGVQLLCSHCPCMLHYIHKSFLVTFQRKVKSKKRCPRTEWDVVWNNTPLSKFHYSALLYSFISSDKVTSLLNYLFSYRAGPGRGQGCRTRNIFRAFFECKAIINEIPWAASLVPLSNTEL